jgi:tryptophan-rich sensory protein
MKLLGCIAVMEGLSFLTSYFVTRDAVNGWYQTIQKSPLTPPDWVFAPVWITLYAMLAVALWLLWNNRHSAHKALGFFLVQLALNYMWSPLFFGMAMFDAALGVLLAMIVTTVMAMAAAWKADRRVTWLMAPYLAWISFAAHLNYTIMALNLGKLKRRGSKPGANGGFGKRNRPKKTPRFYPWRFDWCISTLNRFSRLLKA